MAGNIITVIDWSFNTLGIIYNYTALVVKRKFQDIGTFELTLPLDTNFLPILKENNIMYYQKGDQVEGYIIIKKEFVRDTNGVETVKIYGKNLLYLLNFRIINENMEFKKNYAGTLINRIVNINAITPTDKNRIIPNLSNTSTSGGLILDSYNNSYGKCADEICKIAKRGNIGVNVLIDLKYRTFKFITMPFIDKSVNGSPEDYILFSREFNNLLDEKFTLDNENYNNMAYVLGEGEGSARKKVEVNSNLTGFNRRELYVDARDLQKETMTDNEYETLLINRGDDKLRENETIRSFESKVDTSTYKYMEDWNLGYIVTIQDKKWGITMDSPIIEIQETYQGGTAQITPTFENKVPTIIDKIKKVIKNE